jgi:2'-5' RNA ligase
MAQSPAAEYRLKQLELFEELEAKAAAGAFGSFIPMTSDFANDNRISLAAIKFLPKDLSDLIERELSHPLLEIDEQQFFFANESLHMTVQNVRKISDHATFGGKEIEAARLALEKVAADFSPFEFSLEGLLVMPASVAIRAIAEPRFAEFSRAIRDQLRAAGVADDKPYINDDVVFGNITFCRYTAPPTDEFMAKIEQLRGVKLGTLKIDSFELLSTNSICDLNKTTCHQKYLLSAVS